MSATQSGRFSLPRRVALPAGAGPVFVVLGLVLLALVLTGEAYQEPSGHIALLKRAAPLIILALGQYFVIVTGGFDLSVGSLVTAQVVIAARLIDGETDRTWPVMGLLLLIGAVVGLVNGVISTVFRVPSFITTLGMLLILEGAVFLWSGGAPRGALSPEFRMLGRGSIEDLPVIGQLPYSVILLVALAVGAAWFMRSAKGKLVLAVGDNDRAVWLAGGRITRIRIGAFVVSGVAASIAAILLGGFSGVSAQVGQGLEFEAITAVVLGGVALGGGAGSVVAAMAGALTLKALFSLLSLLGVSGALESTVQGLIIVAAVAYASARSGGRVRPRPTGTGPSPDSAAMPKQPDPGEPVLHSSGPARHQADQQPADQ